MKYVFRIIAIPAFMIVALLGAIRLWIWWCVNYIRYGGEAIVYTEKHMNKTINDVFEQVRKTNER